MENVDKAGFDWQGLNQDSLFMGKSVFDVLS